MADDVGLRTIIRAAIVVGVEVNIHLPVLELLPGQGQWMAAAVTKEYSTKQIIPTHPGRTVNCTPFVRQVWYNTCTKKWGVFLWVRKGQE